MREREEDCEERDSKEPGREADCPTRDIYELREKRTGSKVTGKIRRVKTIATKKTGIGEADYKIKDA